jgi:AsmA protein
MRWVIRLAGVLLLIAVVAIGSVLLLPGDRIARIAADQIKAQTGRDLVFRGETQVTLWPVLGIATGPVTLANASWSDQGPMFAADSLSIGVNTAGLFGGNVRITKVEAENPVVRLEQRADGRANWLFRPVAAPSTTGSSPAGPDQGAGQDQFVLEHLDVKNARLIYAVEGQDTIDIGNVDLTLLWPDPAGAAQFNATARPTGEPLSIKVDIAQFMSWSQGRPQPVSVSVAGPGGAVTFEGVAGILGELAGQTQITTPDTGAFLNALGVGPVDVPQGLGRKADIRAKVTLTRDGALALRDAVMKLDGNNLRADADIQLGDVPQINARLSAEALNLSGLGGDAAGTAGAPVADAGTSPSGWSTTAIDASALSIIEGNVSLTTGSLDFGTLNLDATRIDVQITRARAVVTIGEIRAYDGRITGEVVLNNRNGFSTGGTLKGTGIALNGVLSDVAGWTRLTGLADVEFAFLGAGQSVDQIVRSLSGEGTVAVGRGTFTGLDLDRLIRSGDVGGGTTVFDSLTASMVMQNGDVLNDDLLLILPQVETRGVGRIGLGRQDIDYLITPVAVRARSGSGLAIPVRISGPWASPRIVPDVGAALELNFEQERKAIEDQVQQEVGRALEKELGIVTEQGQSTEDAIQDKLEKELGRSLKKLFD